MKSISKFLTLLLCFELIVAPFGTNIGIMNNYALAETCPTGQTYDATLNRCLTTDQAAQVMNATQNCGGDMTCYMSNATAALQNQINNDSVGELQSNLDTAQQLNKGVAIMAATMLTFAIFRSGSKGYVCSALSYGLIAAGAVSMVVFDIIINKKHKNNLSSIKSDWGKIVNPSTAAGDLDEQREASINAQSQSFEMLARSEDSFANAAGSKQTLYRIAAIAYFAGAAVAAIELIYPTSNCPKWVPVSANNEVQDTNQLASDRSLFAAYTEGNEKPDFYNKQFYYNLNQSKDFTSLLLNKKAMTEKSSSPSIDEFELIERSIENKIENDPTTFDFFKKIYVAMAKGLNPIQIAHAEEKTNAAVAFEQDGKKFDDMTIEFIGMGAGVALGLWVPIAGEYINTSWGRTILGVILGTTTAILANYAGEVKESSEARAVKLREMKTEFDSGSSAIYSCKSEDREDPGKPNCYCYTPKNQKNPNRGNSQVCQNLWAGPGVKFKTTNFASSTGKMCIDAKSKADPNCACKKTGTCLKVSLTGLKGISPGSLSMLTSDLDPLNNLTNGNSGNANLTADSAQKSAMRMKDLKNRILDSSGLRKYKGKISKAEKALTGSIEKMANANPISNPMASSSSGLPTNAKDAARMLEKELTPPGPTAVTGNQGTIATPSGSEDKMPDFGMSDDQAVKQEAQVAEVMGKNLDYGGTDINNSSKANIFEVLTNRYQRSGMKRLFDENNTAPVEAPSKTEINK